MSNQQLLLLTESRSGYSSNGNQFNFSLNFN